MLRPPAFLLACSLLPLTAHAGSGLVFLDTRFSAAPSDLGTGVRLGLSAVSPAGVSYSLFYAGEFRPLPAGLRITMDTRVYEPRGGTYATGPGASIALPVGLPGYDGLSLALGAGAYVVGENSLSTWSGWTEAGLRFPVGEECHIEAGWQYCPLPESSAHRAVLQFRFRTAGLGDG